MSRSYLQRQGLLLDVGLAATLRHLDQHLMEGFPRVITQLEVNYNTVRGQLKHLMKGSHAEATLTSSRETAVFGNGFGSGEERCYK